MFWSSWEDLRHILVVCVLGYLALVVMLKISGNRTLSKMNSFDFVITIALGSTFASGVLQKSVPLSDLIFALFLLIGLQYLVTWISVRSPGFENIIKTEPTLLYKDGQILHGSLRKVRVTEREIVASAREQGHLDLSEVRAVFLESDGSLSCIKGDQPIGDQAPPMCPR